MARKKKPSGAKSRRDTAKAGKPSDKQAQSARGGSSDVLGTSWFPLVVLALVAVFAVYLWLFYAAPMPSLTRGDAALTRGELVVLLFMSIGEIPVMWTGGDWSSVGVVDRLPIVLVAAALTCVAFVCGWLLLALLRADCGLSRIESFVFSTAVGMNVVSLYVLALGLGGQLRNIWLYVVPGLAVVALGGYAWKRRTRPAEKGPSDRGGTAKGDLRPADNDWLRSGWLWMAVPFAAVIMLGAMLPPIDFDVREYHLQVPKQWYQAGRVEFLPHNVYGNMPLGPQILSIPAMAAFGGELDWWWGALVGKTLLGMYAPLTCLALFAAGRRFFSPAAGAVAAVVYISIPWVAKVSMSGLVDGVWAFYVFAACYAALIALPIGGGTRTGHTPDGDDQAPSHPGRATQRAGGSPAGRSTISWPHLILAGFLAGAAVSCKYPSLAFVVLPLAVWAGCALRRPNWRAAGVFLLAVFCSCGLWLGKNWMLTGNPVYPLACHELGGETRTAEKIAQWERAHRIPVDEAGRRWSLAQAGEAVSRLGWRSTWLSPLLVPLALLALLAVRDRRTVIWLAAMSLCIFAVWWGASHRIDRFLLPMFPFLALLAGVGATWSAAPWWRHTVLAVLFWGLVGNLLLVSAGTIGVDNRFLVRLDRLRDDPIRVNPVHRHLNRAVRSGQRVLLVGDAQVFDLTMPVLYNTCFDDCRFEQMMKGRSVGERADALARHAVAYVYVHWGELARYRSPGNYGYSDYATPKTVGELIDAGILGEPVGDFPPYYGQLFPVLDD